MLDAQAPARRRHPSSLLVQNLIGFAHNDCDPNNGCAGCWTCRCPRAGV